MEAIGKEDKRGRHECGCVAASGMAVGGPEAAPGKTCIISGKKFREQNLMFDLYSPLNVDSGAPKLPPEYQPVFTPPFISSPTCFRLRSSNPFNLNPLKAVLSKVIDFDRLNQSPERGQLFLQRDQRPHPQGGFISDAGDLHRCRARFALPSTLLAGRRNRRRALLGWRVSRQSSNLSADLSQEIEGRRDRAGDLGPARRACPRAPRISEISFNSSLMQEMSAIASETPTGWNAAQPHVIHWIGNDRLMSQLGTATQFHPEWSLLCRLGDRRTGGDEPRPRAEFRPDRLPLHHRYRR